MRKDYLPIDPAVAQADEATFVEGYWTERWRDRPKPVDVAGIARREEYRILRSVLDRLPRGGRVLDGGCGMGEWTVFLSGQGFNVAGVDISEQTVARLTEWHPRLEFVRADLRSTAFESASFDAYFSWGTFEHFESGIGDCVAEAHRLLKPGGFLIVSVPFDNGRLRVRNVCVRWLGARRREPSRPDACERFYQWRFTRDELRRELERHGFDVHSTTPVGKLTGAGRLLRSDLQLFSTRSRTYNAACRLVAMLLPARFIGHMVVAVAERR